LDPGSGKNSSWIWILDPGGKKAPDPGTESATLHIMKNSKNQEESRAGSFEHFVKMLIRQRCLILQSSIQNASVVDKMLLNIHTMVS
jgi:16S rRNA A1518/A1519 N6-dimethyltransferase RsmA/KsgA/DIM1 with predicted DNA glycosylase/AP lyase activity